MTPKPIKLLWMNVNKAAHHLGISRYLVSQMVLHGQLKTRRVGKHDLVSVADIERWEKAPQPRRRRATTVKAALGIVRTGIQRRLTNTLKDARL